MRTNKIQVSNQINELIATRSRFQSLIHEIKCTPQHDDYQDLNTAKLRLMKTILSLTVTIDCLKKTIVPKNQQAIKICTKPLGLSNEVGIVITREYHHV